jgi:hypothetical protein
MTHFLKFPDEATAIEVMADYYQPYVEAQEGYYEGEGDEQVWHPPVEGKEAMWLTAGYWWGLDVLGVITRPVGEPDEEGNQETETLEGWHLNFNGELPTKELEDGTIVPFSEDYIVEPSNPARTFA